MPRENRSRIQKGLSVETLIFVKTKFYFSVVKGEKDEHGSKLTCSGPGWGQRLHTWEESKAVISQQNF